jgi:DNA-binding beta-propeller fold protein YncE
MLFALAAFGGPAAATDATVAKKLWETSGFANPESALPDVEHGVIYVSNVNGAPDGKDGNGFISKVGLDGKIVSVKWATGIDAPKGMGLAGGKLYAADIDKLREIDPASGKIITSFVAKDAKFLNDVAVDDDGNVYVSDMATNVIWRLSKGAFEPWLSDPKLENPNGLTVEDGNLRVAAWGVMSNGFETKVPGHLKSVAIESKRITDLGDGKPFGNLDGLEPLGGGAYLISDWMAGKVMKFATDGSVTTLLELGQGSADIGYDPASRTLYVPQMMKSTLSAYKIE